MFNHLRWRNINGLHLRVGGSGRGLRSIAELNVREVSCLETLDILTEFGADHDESGCETLVDRTLVRRYEEDRWRTHGTQSGN